MCIYHVIIYIYIYIIEHDGFNLKNARQFPITSCTK